MSRPDEIGEATRRMVRFLADRTDDGRLIRGHELFDSDQLANIEIESTYAEAAARGSWSEPYMVTMSYPSLEQFDASRATRFRCNCPDWGDPCKHGVALALAVADHLDRAGRAVPVSADAAGPGSATATAPPMLVPNDPPTWAEHLPEPITPRTIDEWLGGPSGGVRRPVELHADDELDAFTLEPLRMPGGVDLAPEISLLRLRLGN